MLSKTHASEIETHFCVILSHPPLCQHISMGLTCVSSGKIWYTLAEPKVLDSIATPIGISPFPSRYHLYRYPLDHQELLWCNSESCPIYYHKPISSWSILELWDTPKINLVHLHFFEDSNLWTPFRVRFLCMCIFIAVHQYHLHHSISRVPYPQPSFYSKSYNLLG